MFRYRFLRYAAVALGLYGVLGLFTAGAMLVVGASTFQQVAALQTTLETERTTLVRSIRMVSGTLRDTAAATVDFKRGIDNARTAADTASKLANDSAGTFRELAASMTSVRILGLAPLASVAPQFDRNADQLQELAISLGATRDALAQSGSGVVRVGTDLNQLQTQLDGVAASLGQPGVLGLGTRGALPFQIAFYGMCVLVILQSAFSIIAGVALFRLQQAMGTQPLFSFAR